MPLSARAVPSQDPEARVGIDDLRLASIVLAASVVIILVLATPLLTGRVPVQHYGLAGCDITCFHLPLRQFYADCLARHESFDWMPGLFCGFFLTGEGQAGTYHPLHLMLYRLLPVDTAFGLELALPVPFLFAGMVLLLRHYGVGALAATFGAASFTFSFHYLQHVEHPNYAAVLSHLPWTLYCIELTAGSTRRSTRMLGCAGIAALTGSCILLGHPQALWFTAIACAAAVVYLMSDRRLTLHAFGFIAVGVVLGCAVGGVQLASTLVYFAESTRAEADADFTNVYSLHPLGLLGLVAPSMAWGRAQLLGAAWLGVAPLTLAAWCLGALGMRQSSPIADERDDAGDPAAVSKRMLGRFGTKLALFYLLLALVMGWLALGRYGGLWGYHAMLPVVGKFRCPTRTMTIVQFAVAVIAAVGLGRLSSLRQSHMKVPWRHLATPWALAIASAVFGCYLYANQGRHESSALQLSTTFGPSLFLLAALGITMMGRGLRGGTILLLIVGLLDIVLHNVASTNAKCTWRHATTWEQYLANTQPQIPVAGEGRVLTDAMDMNCYTLHGIQLAGGYAGLLPGKTLRYDALPALRLSQVDRLRFCWSDMNIAGLGTVAKNTWVEIPQPVDRVRLVSHGRFSTDPNRELGSIDIDTTALTARPVELDGGDPGRCRLIKDRPGDMAIEVDVSTRQLLVISESFHPGWQVVVDGIPAATERVNGDFLGCVVSPGDQRVEFRFDPHLVDLGRRTTWAGWLGVAGLSGSALGLLRRRPAGST